MHDPDSQAGRTNMEHGQDGTRESRFRTTIIPTRLICYFIRGCTCQISIRP
jgi:hypothetical protein